MANSSGQNTTFVKPAERWRRRNSAHSIVSLDQSICHFCTAIRETIGGTASVFLCTLLRR